MLILLRDQLHTHTLKYYGDIGKRAKMAHNKSVINMMEQVNEEQESKPHQRLKRMLVLNGSGQSNVLIFRSVPKSGLLILFPPLAGVPDESVIQHTKFSPDPVDSPLHLGHI